MTIYQFFKKLGTKVHPNRSNKKFPTSIVSADLRGLNVSKMTNMTGLFENCDKLDSLNVSNWDVSNVTNMYTMFRGCGTSNLTLDLNNWNVSNVLDIDYMFEYCNAKYIKVSKWNTKKVKSIEHMFNSCKNLVSLDIND